MNKYLNCIFFYLVFIYCLFFDIIKPKNVRFKFNKNNCFMYVLLYIWIFYMLYSLIAHKASGKKKRSIVSQCLPLTFRNHASSTSEKQKQPHILWRVSLLSTNHNHSSSNSSSPTQSILIAFRLFYCRDAPLNNPSSPCGGEDTHVLLRISWSTVETHLWTIPAAPAAEKMHSCCWGSADLL